MGAFVKHRRSRRAIATFSGFEADLLRSLAAQLVELLDRGLVAEHEGRYRLAERSAPPS